MTRATRFLGGAFSCFLLSGVSLGQQEPLCGGLEASFQASNPDPCYGMTVSISGDLAIVGSAQDSDRGAFAGAAYIYRRTGSSWILDEKLFASNTGPRDAFGRGVSISGETLIVGAPEGGFGPPERSGSVYVFVRSGSSWAQQAVLADPAAQIGDQFGSRVVLDGDRALVNCRFGVCVFLRTGTNWSWEQTLTPSGGSGVGFGISFDLEGDVAVVGATGSLDQDGEAYVYRRDLMGWSQEQRLIATDGQDGDRFGISVSISDSRILVGAEADDDIAQDMGSAYLFKHDGAIWQQERKLLPGDGDVSDGFGFSVAISGDSAYVGSPFHDGDEMASGSVYVYQENGGNWGFEGKLVPGNSQSLDLFGRSVSVSGKALFAGGAPFGSRSGKVYCYRFGLGSVSYREPMNGGPGLGPIVGAKIVPYKLVGGTPGQNDATLELLTAYEVTTGAEGTFSRPQPFVLRDQGVPEFQVRLGWRAELTYRDPGLDEADGDYVESVIINYPGNDPWLPERTRIEGCEDVYFPAPVILQSGLWSGIEGFDFFGDYLRSDPADASSFPTHPKSDLALPAFVTLTVPSEPSFWGDGVSWGYDNTLPRISDAQHTENRRVLASFYDQQARSALADHVSSVPSEFPVHVVGHSMGGIITRGWLSRVSASIPQRYVTFDAVHGGTSPIFPNSATLFGALGFAEWYMNGLSGAGPPVDRGYRGWNYFHRLDNRWRRQRLLISSRGFVVTPDCSALGVGRTMSVPGIPNGHQGRFVGGYELSSDLGHSAVKEDPALARAATRFLAYGAPPTGSVLSATDGQCTPMRSENGRGVVEVPGIWEGEISAVGSGSDLSVFFDSNGEVLLEVGFFGDGASFELLDPNLVSLAPDTSVESFPGSLNLTYVFSSPSPGTYTARLTPGVGESDASLTAHFSNDRRFVLDPVPGVVPVLSAVPLIGRLEDGAGNVLVGSAGQLEVTVTKPDSTRETVVLLDDGMNGDGGIGDGVYGGLFASTSSGGRYTLIGRGVVTESGEEVARSGRGVFAVDSQPGSFASGIVERSIDADGDGLIEQLVFDFDLHFAEVGDFALMADLTDGTGALIQRLSRTVEVQSAGSSRVEEVSVSTAVLVAHGEAGPWNLTSIELVDLDDSLVVDNLSDYSTSVTDLSILAGPPVPSVSELVPSFGSLSGGNDVFLLGANLGSVVSISVGGTSVGSFQGLGEDSILLTMPPAPPSGDLTVDVELMGGFGVERLIGVYTFVYDSCEDGSVNAGVGNPVHSLFINGSAGEVVVGVSETIEIALQSAPAGPAPGRYFLWVWIGAPQNPTPLMAAGSLIGCLANPTPLHPGLEPQPFRCLRGAGIPGSVCTGVAERGAPPEAPWSISSPGLTNPFVATLQAVLEDAGSLSPLGFSASNAVVLKIE